MTGPDPWGDPGPIRAEIFGPERLEHHAQTLAAAQKVGRAPRRPDLLSRLSANEALILKAYRHAAAAVEAGHAVPPAAEWLLDNIHIVEAQVAQVRADLPPGYLGHLPKLSEGHLAGYPRIFGLGWAYVAHGDSLLSAPVLRRFVLAYQEVQPLTIGELWAVAISLRLLLVENLRRLALGLDASLAEARAADLLVEAVLKGARIDGPPLLPDAMAARIAKRLRGMDPTETPLAAWLETRLAAQGQTVEALVQAHQASEGAAHVTMRNIITSMRRMAETDWAREFEATSGVEARLRQGPLYPAMDFPTRNAYRSAIERLARPVPPEARAAREAEIAERAARHADPGQVLLGEGTRAFAASLGHRPFPALPQAWGPGAYLAGVALVSSGFLTLAGSWALAPLAVEAGLALTHLGLGRLTPPRRLPGLALREGIPEDCRTLVVVPVLLSGPADLAEMLRRLEVHHLSSCGGAVSYALLSDSPDADAAETPTDRALIAQARDGIARLNAQHGPRFHLLHRKRLWSPAEGVWMGWERKRGKLMELNALLRGAQDTSFLPGTEGPEGVRFVVTLDADTRLPRETLRRMVGKMAHPLNAPRADASGRVIAGHALLQPRVTARMPGTEEGSAYQAITSAEGGMQPYAAARSDLWQDLFDEGSFTGKGIYDVDAFAAALRGRVPENALLSHDLYEGAFARSALVSDIQLIEDFPTRAEVDARRQHRWTRGDWQLLPFLLRPGLSALNRWKMVDNLRRSLTPPLALLGLVVAGPMALVLMALPHGMGLPLALLPGRAGVTSRSHLQALASDLGAGLAQVGLAVALLPQTAAERVDAIARALWRLGSGRHRLEWTTSAASAATRAPGLAGQYRAAWPGLALAAGAVALAPSGWMAGLGALWVLAPCLSWALGRPRRTLRLAAAEARQLRLIARRSWRYFETHVTEATHHLPPDNRQESPLPVVALRTSPTNIGLYLLSVVAAVDMGWISLAEAARRIHSTLTTVEALPRHRGHLFNWIATDDLRVLEPAYVSTVDSGNLAGHLIALAGAWRRWQVATPPDPQGRADVLALAQEAAPDLAGRLDLAHPADLPALLTLDLAPEARHWIEAMAATHRAGLEPLPDAALLEALAVRARSLAMAMDFAFLMQPEKPLLSIGYRPATNSLDPSSYDLLASEAQLASLIAIAKGDAPTRHWHRLGRAATPVGAGSALISWSGSMFEYLMPALVLTLPAASRLAETHRRVVALQRAHAARLGLPWGVSESAYNARDPEMTYQYSNFGVPGLGLKRGLGENRVIAPYATALAAMIAPRAALRNFQRLTTLGALGPYGYAEAIDFTPARLPEGVGHVVVQSTMAHHQGMTVVALANLLTGRRIPADFHADPAIEAIESLLQEPQPRDAPLAPPRAREVRAGAEPTALPEVLRPFPQPGSEAPTAHLLSNGRYGLVLTPGGAGGSSWQGLAITRWRPDPTQARQGSFILLRDVLSGGQWSATAQPFGDRVEAVFSDHHALFTHRTRLLTTRTEVLVSAEDDAEARRVTLTNQGRHRREIDLTSYAELILGDRAADTAHPAFSKMFIVTDVLPELGALIATRRRRSPEEPEVWAAHLAVVEGQETAALQFETARERFIGRGRDLSEVALDHPLSGHVGTVLDPIFALRRRVAIPGGGRARVTFWTLVASNPEALLAMVERHCDPAAFGRAMTLAWTQARVEARHLGLTPTQLASFQWLAGMILRADPRLRPRAAPGPQSDLWALGISGDRPILLVVISDPEDMGPVRDAVAAVEFWRLKQLAVDLVILNDRAASYIEELQGQLETLARRAGGTVLASSRMTPGAVAALRAAAAVVIEAARGPIADQLDLLPRADFPPPLALPPIPPVTLPVPELEFFNGTGGFAEEGRAYVTHLSQGSTTPAPWINVIANPLMGFQVSAEGAGFTWVGNARENQLTPWSNDPVSDPPSEVIYLQDLETGEVWTPTALPMRGQGSYLCRHGFGHSRFEHQSAGVASTLTLFMDHEAPIKVARLALQNLTNRRRVLGVTAYVAWDGGVTTERDPSGAVLARRARGGDFAGHVAFADFGPGVESLTCDRAEVIGRRGTLARPTRLWGFSGRVGAHLDPCAALARRVVLAPGARVELDFTLGQGRDLGEAQALIAQGRQRPDLGAVSAFWSGLLGQVQVQTPDRALDILLNGWLAYQALSCRIWGRAGFYQASGAYGFRDQLQDGMALASRAPALVRAHLLRAGSRQFSEGDVQHWWLPQSGRGIRTRISDDRVWLAHAVAHYVQATGDAAVLDEPLPFLTGPALHGDEAFFAPGQSDEVASLRDHCARGLDQALSLRGENGLPLMGTGDWNDGMNRVGAGGKSTSVWLGWFLVATLRAMAPHVPARRALWEAEARALTEALEREAWDGGWYRRGSYDDGSLLGSATSEACQIDLLPQAWAVLSAAARPERAATALAEALARLVRDDRLRLFTPPFDRGAADPGYVKAYPPGLRENGGQYTHAALWAVLACARLGQGAEAARLMALLNPIRHALTPEAATLYRVEPYVVAADVYDAPGQEGRGGWTWYTGSAAWMLRAGIEGILGLTQEGDRLRLMPCLPPDWPEVRLTLTLGPAPCRVTIRNRGGPLTSARLNGRALSHGKALTLPLSELRGLLELDLGPPSAMAPPAGREG